MTHTAPDTTDGDVFESHTHTATMRDGVLTVHIPKNATTPSEEEKPKRIINIQEP